MTTQAPALPAGRPLPASSFFLIICTHFFNDGFSVLLLPFLPLFVKDFHLGAVGAGSIVTAYAVSAALFQLPIALFADIRRKRKLVLTCGLILSGLASMLYGLSPSFGALLIFAFVAGIGFAPFHPAAFALIASSAPPGKKGLFLGTFNIGGTLGMALVPLLAGLIAASANWRVAVLPFGPLVILLAILTYFVFPEPKPAENPSSVTLRETLSALARNRPLQRVVTVTGLRAFGWRGTLTFIPLLLAQSYGWSEARVAVAVFTLSIAGCVVQPVFGALSDRIGRWRIIAVTLTATAAASVLLIVAHTDWLLFALMTVWGGISIGLRPLFIAQITDVVGAEHHSSGVGSNFLVTQGMGALAPLAGGVIATLWGITFVFPFFAVCFLAAIWPARRAFKTPQAATQGA